MRCYFIWCRFFGQHFFQYLLLTSNGSRGQTLSTKAKHNSKNANIWPMPWRVYTLHRERSYVYNSRTCFQTTKSHQHTFLAFFNSISCGMLASHILKGQFLDHAFFPPSTPFKRKVWWTVWTIKHLKNCYVSQLYLNKGGGKVIPLSKFIRLKKYLHTYYIQDIIPDTKIQVSEVLFH